ncbi:MAG: DUF5591 domain-containing protein [Thermoplasmatota archaeon]
MSGDDWTYRFGIIDVMTRRGELQLGGERFQLPVLLDPADNGGRMKVLHPKDGWESIYLTFGDLEAPSVVPEALRDALTEALRKMDAAPLSPVVCAAGKGLFGGKGEASSKLPVRVQQYFGIVAADPRKAALAIAKLTLSDPLRTPLYFPGLIDQGNLEVLFYLGVEVFDTLHARMDAMSGLYYTDTGPIPYERLTRTGTMQTSCGCSGCDILKDGPPPSLVKRAITEHNIEHMRRRLEIAEIALEEGRLRQLVMGRLAGNPGWVSALRAVERSLGAELDIFTPSYRSMESTMVTYRDDLTAPDFTAWRRSIAENYVPVKGRNVLLLLPCSARKPYSTSRTHQRIREALKGLKGWRGKVQQVVITSPLGAVPMELEDLYPASHYDIPVTGEWFPEELEASRELVSSIFRRGEFRSVVCFHREGGEFFPPDVSGKLFPGADLYEIHSMADEAGEDPYKLLFTTLMDVLPEGRDASYEKEDLFSLVRYSIGVDLDPIKGLEVRWSKRGRELRRDKEPIMVFKKGGPVPTSSGGRLLWDLVVRDGGKRVVIDDFHPKGTVFSQGIVRCSGEVRTGDIVLVGTEEEYRGVGRALVPGPMMTGSVHGPAVKILHCAK